MIEDDIATKTQTPIPTFPSMPPNLAYISPKLQHDISIFYPPTLHKSYDSARFIEEKLATTQVRFSYSKRLSPFKPPKFVFLQPKNEPPWKPTGYKIMSLEDKARVEDCRLSNSTSGIKSFGSRGVCLSRIDQEGFVVVVVLGGAEGNEAAGYRLKRVLLIFEYLKINKVGGGCFLSPVIQEEEEETVGCCWLPYKVNYTLKCFYLRGAKFDIKEFDVTGDFGLWRVKMRGLLIQHGFEAALEVFPEDMKAQAKAEPNKKVHSAVILCFGNKVLREVTEETIAAGVWTKLETLYMTKSLANKLDMKKKLYTFYMRFEDEDLSLLLLNSLPASYEHFVDTLLYGREALTLEDVMATLNSKEIKERSKAKGDDGEGLYVRGRTDCKDSRQSKKKSRSKSRDCSLSHTVEEIQAYVQTQCAEDDAARQEAIMGVITLFEQGMAAKEYLKKQYAECKDISPE
nr:retrovirus-related Pol polyprotein from transposon TNT 1-94 [Tanacetum cinerariifolium]